MMFTAFLVLYLLGAVGGLISMPVLDGYHKKKYGREWSIISNNFKYLPDTFFFFFGSLTWPLAIPLFFAGWPTVKLIQFCYYKLHSLGEGIIQKSLDTKEKSKYLLEAELEVEKMLRNK